MFEWILLTGFPARQFLVKVRIANYSQALI